MDGGLTRRELLLLILIALFMGTASFSLVMWRTGGHLYRNDGTAYFLCARSAVVDLDTDVTNEFETMDARFPPDAAEMMAVRYSVKREQTTGRVLFPWPVGAGLVMTPAFAAGLVTETVVAWITGRPVDSYGAITQFFYGLGSLGYGILGVWTTVLCCRRIGSRRRSWGATLAAVFCGPAVFYILFHPTMAHASSFGLVGLLVLLCWRRWDGEARGLAIVGLLFGILVIVRYQNVVWGVLPLAVMIKQTLQVPPRRAARGVLMFALGAAGPVMLQVFHLWQSSPALTVGVAGGGMELAQNQLDLRSPHFLEVLVSCQHGLFYWFPALLLACIGLVWGAWSQGWLRVLLVAILGNVYLIGTLEGMGGTNWSGAYSFGMRYLTESTPVFAVGLAVLLNRTPWTKGRLAWQALLALLVAWNGLLILAYSIGTISRVDCVTWADMGAGVAEALGKLL